MSMIPQRPHKLTKSKAMNWARENIDTFDQVKHSSIRLFKFINENKPTQYSYSECFRALIDVKYELLGKPNVED